MDSQVSRPAAAEPVAGAGWVTHESCRNALELEHREYLFGLFNVATQIAFAVNDERGRLARAQVLERAHVPEFLRAIPRVSRPVGVGGIGVVAGAAHAGETRDAAIG